MRSLHILDFGKHELELDKMDKAFELWNGLFVCLFDWCLRLESKLADFLKSGKDWERKPTTVGGVFVLKMPPFRGSPARLAVELNPVDDAGRATRKRGVLLRSSDELAEYKRLIEDERLTSLLKNLDALSPKPEKKEAPKADIIEI